VDRNDNGGVAWDQVTHAYGFPWQSAIERQIETLGTLVSRARP
jgi:hypothetical protein